jgi:hypothetical protein
MGALTDALAKRGLVWRIGRVTDHGNPRGGVLIRRVSAVHAAASHDSRVAALRSIRQGIGGSS